MQSFALQISMILKHAETAHPTREIVSRLSDGAIWRYDYLSFADRTRRCANLLAEMGIGAGDRVTSLAWNTHQHMELFFAVPGIGAVLHTANPRLSDDQIAFTIRHAESRIVFFDPSFADLADRLRVMLPQVRLFVRLHGTSGEFRSTSDPTYEERIAASSGAYDWPSFDENEAAFLCYTSGTTGDPKGVLYSHRSIVLHGLAAGLAGALGFTAFDCIMPCQSLYHGTAWGLPFIAAINGCKIVLPADKMDGASLHELIRDEGVTFSSGVPTIWTMYLSHLEKSGEGAASLRRLVIGGSAVPRTMAETFEVRYGVTVSQLWGMTETSPLGVVATPTPLLAAAGEDALKEVVWGRQGRRQFGIELKIVDDSGGGLPSDGEHAGSLLVRGPWVLERYYRSEQSALDQDGWFETGDIATIDTYGFVRITDRKKDVIKSGGEWVSSIDVENVAASMPGVKVAAVVGVYHPKWEERPIIVIEAHDGYHLTKDALLAHLSPHMPRWWLPDAVLFEAVPLTATGKIDKKRLRERHGSILFNRAEA